MKCEVAVYRKHPKKSISPLRSFRLSISVVSPTACSPTSRVDSPTSGADRLLPTYRMSVRLRLNYCKKQLIHQLDVLSRSLPI